MRTRNDLTVLVLGLLTLMLVTLWLSTVMTGRPGLFYQQDLTGVQRLSIDQRLITEDGAAYRS